MSFEALPCGECSPDTLLNSAREASREGRWDDARRLFIDAVQCDETGRALRDFGEFLFQTSAHQEAQQVFHRLRQLACHRGDAQLRAVACHHLAAVAREQHHPLDAQVWQQQAIRAQLEQPEAPLLQPEDLVPIASDAMLRGEYPYAKALLQSALSQAEAASSPTDQADCWGSLGVLANLQGDSIRAVQCLVRAFRLHRTSGDLAGCGRDLLNLAEMAAEFRRWELAERLARTAARVFGMQGSSLLMEKARRLGRRMRRIHTAPDFNPLCN